MQINWEAGTLVHNIREIWSCGLLQKEYFSHEAAVVPLLIMRSLIQVALQYRWSCGSCFAIVVYSHPQLLNYLINEVGLGQLNPAVGEALDIHPQVFWDAALIDEPKISVHFVLHHKLYP